MKLEQYDIDALRSLIRKLQNENHDLKQLLNTHSIPYEEKDIFNEDDNYDNEHEEDQTGIVLPIDISWNVANRFFSMFWGRVDVYAKRSKKGYYFPQCSNRWNNTCPIQQGITKNCLGNNCDKKNWRKLNPEVIMRHLAGDNVDCSDVIGIYPLFDDNTCRLLAFDFDNHNPLEVDKTDWKNEADALRRMCQLLKIPCLLERSRSGKGAHLWIFFEKPISASFARTFGFMLLDKGAELVNLKSFSCYDRMFPAQDYSDGIGNLIALPLQGQAVKKGNTVFVDENWNAYPDQLEMLFSTEKISEQRLFELMEEWSPKGVITLENIKKQTQRVKPWKKKYSLNKKDVNGKMHIVLADGIYVDGLNLSPRIQNQIRSMAAIDNAVFYQNQHMGFSNYKENSVIYVGKDEDGYINIPRGLLDTLIDKCKEADVPYEIDNQRNIGRPIRVSFNGALRLKQDLAAERMLVYEDGVLNAATAFGKTAVGSYLISERKVNTLIITSKKDLVKQWIDELNKFLLIDEIPPKYKTSKGKERQYESVIGICQDGVDKMTGIIDVALVGSVYKKGNINPKIKNYGMIIVDECHHAAAETFLKLLQEVNARYVYGLSATTNRMDKKDKLIYMMIGPIRYKYTAKERARDQGIRQLVYPRFTKSVYLRAGDFTVNDGYNYIAEDEVRNQLIVEDIKRALKEGRTPVVLSRYIKHAEHLTELLKGCADHVYLIHGSKKNVENQKSIDEMKQVSNKETLVLVATLQKLGEGFDFPRLDALFFAMPIRADALVEQNVGRIGRSYPGKKDIIVYDYVDSHISVFKKQYNKRLIQYKKMGYEILSEDIDNRQATNYVYDMNNYLMAYETDLSSANKEIIISSPELSGKKINRLLEIIRHRQEAGISVTVLTKSEETVYTDSAYFMSLIYLLRKNGINVIEKDNLSECFALIDRKIVWHGTMNLLGKEDILDNVIRIEQTHLASELLEVTINDKV